MNYEVKYAMKHGDRCPYCQQVLHVENDVFECGGKGEGICSIWSAIYAFGRAVNRLVCRHQGVPRSASLDVDRWIDEWLAEEVGQSWIKIGWDRGVHLRGVRETWNLLATTKENL
jgi:hypothetical protein